MGRVSDELIRATAELEWRVRDFPPHLAALCLAVAAARTVGDCPDPAMRQCAKLAAVAAWASTLRDCARRGAE